MNRRVRGLRICLAGVLAAVAAAACFNADSHQIVYVSERGGDPEVLLLDPETGRTDRLTSAGVRGFSPRWSPDRKRVAYLTAESGNREMVLWDRDDGATHRITGLGKGLRSPRWSPDGQRLAFVSEADGNPEVYVMKPDGGDLTRLTFNEVADHLGEWSPDGEWLVFYSTGSRGDSGLWLRNPTGVNLIRLTRGNDSEPVWSPDNRRIAFVRTERDSQDIYIAEKPEEGTWRGEVTVKPLTRGSGDKGSPRWSPDGKSIAFVSDREGSAEIYTIGVDGADEQRLTSNSVDDVAPTWSRGGERIAFVSHLYGAGEIYVMDAGGGRQRRLTKNDVEDRQPDW